MQYHYKQKWHISKFQSHSRIPSAKCVGQGIFCSLVRKELTSPQVAMFYGNTVIGVDVVINAFGLKTHRSATSPSRHLVRTLNTVIGKAATPAFWGGDCYRTAVFVRGTLTTTMNWWRQNVCVQAGISWGRAGAHRRRSRSHPAFLWCLKCS